MNFFNILSWVANIFLIIGMWKIGDRKRYAFIFTMIGEATWLVCAIVNGWWSMAFICVIFASAAFINYTKWKKYEN